MWAGYTFVERVFTAASNHHGETACPPSPVPEARPLVSTQPGDPSPHQTSRGGGDGQTDTPPPGFWRSAAALFANRNAKVLLAIVAILLIILGIAMVSAINSTSKEPATAVVHTLRMT